MPAKVKVKIISGRNLPVMDRSSDTTDAYVEIKLGSTAYKTDVCRKTLHPQWNSEWYKFEVDDSELQDEPLQMRLMDHDTYSANDAIGKVYLDLNPLLVPSIIPMMKFGSNTDSNNQDNVTNTVLSGWIPVYDTMHGIRGEVNVIVKVEFFSDFNRYRQSSCGVQFFYSPSIPQGYYAQAIYGFIEELVVNDDPEYQWIDKIRTPRASNEARQTLFFKLSRELQRKIGVKALELGANSVIGYRQCFDLEGEFGIVARGIGTAVFLLNVAHISDNVTTTEECNSSPAVETFHIDHHRSESVGTKASHSPGKITNHSIIHRRSSDSDLSITPKGNSLTGSDRSGCVAQVKHNMMFRPMAHQENFDILEYPFLTITKYPPGFILHIGGAVSARSVKLLERVSNIEEPESRDIWWSELRMEIRSHARALNCNAVLGYTESSSICEDVCILSASGTAAVIDIPHINKLLGSTTAIPIKDDRVENDKEKQSQLELNVKNPTDSEHESSAKSSTPASCRICHLPYTANLQIGSSTFKCALCRNGKVPEVLIATIEACDGMLATGRGNLLQASVHRPLKDLKGEYNAKEISDGLPFLEYELHRILVNKLKIKGMNAILGLKVRISIGERILVGIATGTAVFLAALHPPNLPRLVSDRTADDKKIADLQKRLNETVKRNKEIYQLKNIDEIQPTGHSYPDEDSEEENGNLELSLGNKDYCLLEVDDPEDAEIVDLITEQRPPNGIYVVNTEFVPGLEEMEIVKNLQMCELIYRSKFQYPFNLNQHIQKLLQCIYFKLRRMVPCAVCDLQFRVDVPEADEIQISVLGMALGLGELQKSKPKKKNILKHDDMIFNLEELDISENVVINKTTSYLDVNPSYKNKQKYTLVNKFTKQRHMPYKERHGVDITSLCYIPGGIIERYLGNLNFFLIRETTSIREEGGPSGFVHSFATEVLSIVRAHVTALGGNAMVSHFFTVCVLNCNLHKNQGQCLVNVGGDVVFVSYYPAD